LKLIVFTVCEYEYMNMPPPPHLSSWLRHWSCNYWTMMCPLPNDCFALFISGYNRKQKISLFRCRCGKVDIIFDIMFIMWAFILTTVDNLWCYVFYRVDFVKYPGLAKVEYHYVEMQPGDCLYIPYGWYGDDIAISCSYPCGLDVVWLRFTGVNSVVELWFDFRFSTVFKSIRFSNGSVPT
jgi:hypothetical protein